MPDAVSDYLLAQLHPLTADYALLETLTRLSAERYRQMGNLSSDLNHSLAILLDSPPTLSKTLPRLTDAVSTLEGTVSALKEFVAELEKRI